MKILLINPMNRGYYYRLGAVYPPLGLAYISAALKREGHNVRIVDMNVERFDYVNFDYMEYDLVGISTDTPRFPLARNIAQKVKEKGITVVLGGPHASAEVSDILKKGIADYVILGEGERAFPKLVEALENGERHPEIPGLAYLVGDTLKEYPKKFIENLDEIPFPDREGLNMTRYRNKFDGKPATSIITSRGCPFNCEFCSASQFMGFLWRKRSVPNVMAEVKLLVKKYGYGSLIFFDDNFTLDPKRVIEISEEILKNDLKISWWAFSRADELLEHEDMVEAMTKAGCKMLFIGFESASDTVLEEYNKKLRSSIAFDVVKLLKKYRIDVFASFILGALSDTRETIEKTIRFAKKLAKLGASIVQFSILTPYPGTRLFEKLRRVLITRDYEKYDGTHLVFKHPNFSPQELKSLFKKAYYYVYTTPKLLFKRGLPFLWKLLRIPDTTSIIEPQIESSEKLK
ncbi:MAG: B12-binding domain-containing radical SAM protein [Thermotogae bacterium]|nr:B12-binding domain-containing radical SAM protein [Thermotogota bacterium]